MRLPGPGHVMLTYTRHGKPVVQWLLRDID